MTTATHRSVGAPCSAVLAAAVALGALGCSRQAGPIFDLRTYTAAPDKLEQLHERFRSYTLRLTEKHGMEHVGYWTPCEEDRDDVTLVYMLTFPDSEQRLAAFKAFLADPEWKAAYAESRRNGPLVLDIAVQFLEETDYSLLSRARSSGSGGPARLYELRTYTTLPGKLDLLHARLRDHEVALMEKHGVRTIGYWTRTKGEAVDETLVSLLAFPSRSARESAFEALHADPEWRAIEAETTKEGPLVAKVETLFLAPTDYSPLK